MSKGKIIGYVRVSSYYQNSDRQLEGIVLDKKFVDQASGKDTNRPALTSLLSYVRDGDTVVVHSMDRLARNLDDLRRLVSLLIEKQVKVHFTKEGLVFTGDDTPLSHLLLSVMGAFSEFERALIKERQREGISLAKKRGVYKGRSKKISDDQAAYIQEQILNKVPKSHIASTLGISRQTLYVHLGALVLKK